MEEFDLQSLLFGSSDGQNMEIKKGDLLISEPLMEESIFKRSVILMLTVSEKNGCMGLVLNHLIPYYLSDILPDIKFGKDIPLFAGGPVDLERLFILHTLGDSVFRGSQELLPGIYIGATLKDVVNYINEGGEIEGKLRFFLGYSGWNPNQLESEVLNNFWVVKSDSHSDNLFYGHGDRYWRREVKHLGRAYRSWLTIPSDSSMN